MNLTKWQIEMTQGIYKITNTKDENHNYYIGSSRNIENRWRKHHTQLKHGYHPNPKLQAAWNKYGDGSLTLEIIEEVENLDELWDIEQRYLDIALDGNHCYNIVQKADHKSPPSEETRLRQSKSHKGKKLTEETKKRMSMSRMGHPTSKETREKISRANKGQPGKVHYWLGKSRDEETKRKISESLIGSKLSDETKKKIGEASRGRKHTEEARRKISMANEGKRLSKETKQKIGMAMKGKQSRLGTHASEETRKRLSESHKGHIHSEEHKRKIGEGIKRYWQNKRIQEKNDSISNCE